MTHRRLLWAWATALAAVALFSRPAVAKTLAITHVTVLSMAAEAPPRLDQTVVIEAGRVRAVSAAHEARIPRGARRIDGRGKWLMPALTDAHVHLPNDHYALDRPGAVDTQDQLTPYLVNGVLQVFNLSATALSVAQAREVEVGQVLGPHIANAAMIDGDPPVRPGQTRVAATPADGRQTVRNIRFEGYRYVKVYSRLSEDTYQAIVDEARQDGLKVVGHIPNSYRGHTAAAFVPGYGLVAHAEEFAKQSSDFSDADIDAFAKAAKANGTWLIATLTISDWIARETESLDPVRRLPTLKYLSPSVRAQWLLANPYQKAATPDRLARFRKIVDFNARLVRAFAREGIPILAGTDAMVPAAVPGFSLHDELEMLAQAGLSNRQVLEGATRLPAEWLGVGADRGTLAAGKRADLLLLDADPLADVANTRRIAAVIDGGRYLSRADLAARLDVLAKKFAHARRSAPTSAPSSGVDDDDGC